MIKAVKVKPSGQSRFMGCLFIISFIIAVLVIVGLLLSDVFFENDFSIPGIVISLLILAAIPMGIAYIIPKNTLFYYDDKGFYQKKAKHMNLYANTNLTIYLQEKHKDLSFQEICKNSDRIINFVRVEVRGKSDHPIQFWDNGVNNYRPFIKILLKKIPSKNMKYITYSSYSRGEVGKLYVTYPDGESEMLA